MTAQLIGGLFAMGVLVLGVILGFLIAHSQLGEPSPDRTYTATTLVQSAPVWEYRVVDLVATKEPPAVLLQRLGAEGWELFVIDRFDVTLHTETPNLKPIERTILLLYFKRPLPAGGAA